MCRRRYSSLHLSHHSWRNPGTFILYFYFKSKVKLRDYAPSSGERAGTYVASYCYVPLEQKCAATECNFVFPMPVCIMQNVLEFWVDLNILRTICRQSDRGKMSWSHFRRLFAPPTSAPSSLTLISSRSRLIYFVFNFKQKAYSPIKTLLPTKHTYGLTRTDRFHFRNFPTTHFLQYHPKLNEEKLLSFPLNLMFNKTNKKMVGLLLFP